jgi:hypothetical protein
VVKWAERQAYYIVLVTPDIHILIKIACTTAARTASVVYGFGDMYDELVALVAV